MSHLRQAIQSRALDLGFSDCRVCKAREAPHRALFEQWIKEGCHGEMAWLARTPERRGDPRLVLPGAESIIVLALNYFQGPLPSSHQVLEGKIARYAWNEDYHDLIERKLRALDEWLITQGGQQRYYVDTGPVLERDFASEAGLGWGGKSTMQVHRRLGTYFFLAEIITTLSLPSDDVASDRCGKCTRCIQACPTQAITAPHHLDARRCISYLTIENKGPIPLHFRRAIGDHLYGCDDCLEACPWNRFAQTSAEIAFQARDSLFKHSLAELLAFSEEDFRQLFAKSPIKRIKRHGFLRNVCVVLGNIGKPSDLPALERAVRDPHPLISEHATWAIQEIKSRHNDC